jgi:uncharacterized membrane protein YkvA (DUF1232 family)
LSAQLQNQQNVMKIVQSIIAAGAGIFSLVYLLNPTAGFVELIPDNIPLFGNLDEAAATAILIAALAYFGLDVTRLFGRSGESASSGNPDDVIEAEVQSVRTNE